MQIAKKHSSLLLSAISITAFLALAACETTVVGGGSGGNPAASTSGGTGGTGGNGNGGSGTAGGNPGSSNAIAMLYSEMQSPPNPTGSTGTSTGGGGPDPNTLFIQLSNTPENCNEPYAAEPCGNHYRISIGIPVALQKVGIIALNDMTVISYASYSGLEDLPGQCPGGGGSFIDGELEITAIDSTHVQGILTNTWALDFDANGVFDAPRCVF